jgi:hypothetical protein
VSYAGLRVGLPVATLLALGAVVAVVADAAPGEAAAGSASAGTPATAAFSLARQDSSAFPVAADVEAGHVLADSADRAAASTQVQTDAARRAQEQATRAVQEAAAVKARETAARQAAAQASRDADRDPRGLARVMVAERGWGGGQFSCLDSLWAKESGWNPEARNPSSGAFGIPQALPAGKMSAAGSDWQTNPATQIEWGLDYISSTYGTPCGAWAHSRAVNWY